MLENVNGSPLQMIRAVTMQRAEFSGGGGLCPVRETVCGIELKLEDTSEYQASTRRGPRHLTTEGSGECVTARQIGI